MADELDKIKKIIDGDERNINQGYNVASSGGGFLHRTATARERAVGIDPHKRACDQFGAAVFVGRVPAFVLGLNVLGLFAGRRAIGVIVI